MSTFTVRALIVWYSIELVAIYFFPAEVEKLLKWALTNAQVL
jgi:hypothetical protein